MKEELLSYIESLTPDQYRKEIAELLKRCEDRSLLDFVYQLLYKAQEAS